MRTPTLEELYSLGFYFVSVKDNNSLTALCHTGVNEVLLAFPIEMRYDEVMLVAKRVLIRWRAKEPAWDKPCKGFGKVTEEETNEVMELYKDYDKVKAEG